LITLIVIIVVAWTVIRIVQLVRHIWSLVNAPRVGAAAAA